MVSFETMRMREKKHATKNLMTSKRHKEWEKRNQKENQIKSYTFVCLRVFFFLRMPAAFASDGLFSVVVPNVDTPVLKMNHMKKQNGIKCSKLFRDKLNKQKKTKLNRLLIANKNDDDEVGKRIDTYTQTKKKLYEFFRCLRDIHVILKRIHSPPFSAVNLRLFLFVKRQKNIYLFVFFFEYQNKNELCWI